MARSQKEPKNGLGARIEALRKGMSQEELADTLNISRSSVNMWERNAREMKASDIILLSKFFGITTDELLTGVKPENTDIHRATGLSDAAIDSLRQFKEDDTLPGAPGKMAGNVAALSKALAHSAFLGVVASILTLDNAEHGYYDGCSHTPGEPFYECSLSPDSYAALLSARLTLVLDAIRKGAAIPPYPPAQRRQEAVIEELRKQGRLIEKGGTHNAK